ncbi:MULTISPECIES: hypothetical protein [unclassified Microbacterium]|uniref:hypothetical protein n=1 Tax=unclassified Microbacterium TaxID=2609290 RepID=UPI00301AEAA5
MDSTITIDGVTIAGDLDTIRETYEAITSAIREGKTGDYAVGRREGDYTIRTVFFIQPSTAVSTTLAFSPVDEIPVRYKLGD